MFEHGTKIEVAVGGFGYAQGWEAAKIVRRLKGKRKDLPPYPVAGYHVVEFADGGMLAVHENGFRVVTA